MDNARINLREVDHEHINGFNWLGRSNVAHLYDLRNLRFHNSSSLVNHNSKVLLVCCIVRRER